MELPVKKQETMVSSIRVNKETYTCSSRCHGKKLRRRFAISLQNKYRKHLEALELVSGHERGNGYLCLLAELSEELWTHQT